MRKKTKVVIGVTALTAVIALTAFSMSSRNDRGPLVTTEQVARRDLATRVTASGYVQPKRKVDISADISGRVTELLVDEGQWVESGAILLRIDPTAFEANVRRAMASVAQSRAQAAQAEAGLIRAESELRRAEYLAPDNLIAGAELEQIRTQVVVSRAQMDAAEHGVAQAEAALAEAQEQLRKTTISAPMAGRVTRLNIQQGETAVVGTMNNAGSLLLTIADLSVMDARVRVGETDIPSIHIGDSAVVRIDAYPGQEFSGRVTRISNSAVNAPTSRGATSANQAAQAIDFEVIVTLDEPPSQLRPDLTATADIITETRSQVVAVPILAVTVRDAQGRRSASSTAPRPSTSREESEGVFVLRDGIAEWTPIEVGIVGDWYFEVLSGVDLGDVVIAGPYAAVRDLRPGAEVRVTSSAPRAEPPS